MKHLFTLLFVCFVSLGFAQTDLDQGLVAHYPFDGNVSDASLNKNDGTIHGGIEISMDRFGHRCSAMKFNGTDGYISVPNSPSLSSPTEGLTISVWVKVDNECNYEDRDWFTICCKSNLQDKTDASPQYRFQASPMTISLNTDFTKVFEEAISFEFDNVVSIKFY